MVLANNQIIEVLDVAIDDGEIVLGGGIVVLDQATEEGEEGASAGEDGIDDVVRVIARHGADDAEVVGVP
jgi:hypothetical protein